MTQDPPIAQIDHGIPLHSGTQFDATFKNMEGCNVVIEYGFKEEKFVARWIEEHVKFCMTTILVTEYRRNTGKERQRECCNERIFHLL